MKYVEDFYAYFNGSMKSIIKYHGQQVNNNAHLVEFSEKEDTKSIHISCGIKEIMPYIIQK